MLDRAQRSPVLHACTAVPAHPPQRSAQPHVGDGVGGLGAVVRLEERGEAERAAVVGAVVRAAQRDDTPPMRRRRGCAARGAPGRPPCGRRTRCTPDRGRRRAGRPRRARTAPGPAGCGDTAAAFRTAAGGGAAQRASCVPRGKVCPTLPVAGTATRGPLTSRQTPRANASVRWRDDAWPARLNAGKRRRGQACEPPRRGVARPAPPIGGPRLTRISGHPGGGPDGRRVEHCGRGAAWGAAPQASGEWQAAGAPGEHRPLQFGGWRDDGHRAWHRFRQAPAHRRAARPGAHAREEVVTTGLSAVYGGGRRSAPRTPLVRPRRIAAADAHPIPGSVRCAIGAGQSPASAARSRSSTSAFASGSRSRVRTSSTRRSTRSAAARALRPSTSARSVATRSKASWSSAP
jgi:hypothetical protein